MDRGHDNTPTLAVADRAQLALLDVLRNRAGAHVEQFSSSCGFDGQRLGHSIPSNSVPV